MAAIGVDIALTTPVAQNLDLSGARASSIHKKHVTFVFESFDRRSLLSLSYLN
jgi:hypothetical protein